jgi:hypothetical protein
MDLRMGANHLKIISSESSKFIQKSNVGDYDSKILCSECDQYLGNFDDYGKSVLVDKIHDFVGFTKYGITAGWNINECDSSRLNKFFLAVLWRASISNRPFFRRVKLGPYEDKIRRYIWGEEDWLDNVGCVISKFNVSKKALNAEKTILDPDRLKHRGINYYRLYLGGYAIWIRVDHRKPNDSLGRCEMRNDSQCIVISRSFDDSKELKVLHESILKRAAKI